MPLQAVNHEGKKTTVFVVGRNSEIEDRPIMLGLQTANDAEVVSGLAEGEEVVVSDRSGSESGRDRFIPRWCRSCNTKREISNK